LQEFVKKGWLRIPQIQSNAIANKIRNEAHDVHGYYKFYAFFQPENTGSDMTRDRLVEHLRSYSVVCMQGSCSEIYQEKAFISNNIGGNTPIFRDTHK